MLADCYIVRAGKGDRIPIMWKDDRVWQKSRPDTSSSKEAQYVQSLVQGRLVLIVGFPCSEFSIIARSWSVWNRSIERVQEWCNMLRLSCELRQDGEGTEPKD
jgi:hypothetical protein